ncbi:CIC11C00000001767 [Sungouiella intermedia]|uniref:CIC11C00000001767 n=1 Tax=Sungouiella intermedia TaxID=45354 RepID=A0A1L0DDH8_9ASCO|nr:CIC11C00000001767 [[Candida] intermedia]
MRPLFVSLLGITAVLAADTADYDFLYNTQLFGELFLFIERPDVLSDFAVYDTITLDSPAQTSYDAYIIRKYGSQILSIYTENGYTGTGIFGYFTLNPDALVSIATTYDENETETDSSKASGSATTGSGSATTGSGSATTGSSSARSGVTSETASSGDATTAGSGSTGSGSTSNAASSGSSTSAGGDAGDSNPPLLAVGAVLAALPFFLI